MSPKQKAEKHAPWLPPKYEVADAVALQHLAEGRANPDMQKRALNWIINQAANTYDLSFRPGGYDGVRETDFAEGRRFVGLEIVKLLKVKVGQLRRDP